jgi:hypothetical protein
VNRNSKSGYKGVRFHSDKRGWVLSKPWEARITINGKSQGLGHYSTKEEAAEAYNKKAKEVYGEFAKLN